MKKQWSYLLINGILSLSLMTTYDVSYVVIFESFCGGEWGWGLLYAALALIAVYLFVWVPILSVRYARRVADCSDDQGFYVGLNAIVLALPGFMFIKLPIFFIMASLESFLIEKACIKRMKRKSANVQSYDVSESKKTSAKAWLQWAYPVIWILIIAAVFAAWYSMMRLVDDSYDTVRWIVTVVTLTLYIFVIVPLASYRYGRIICFKDKGKWIYGVYNGLLISVSYVCIIICCVFGGDLSMLLHKISAAYAIKITLGTVFLAVWTAAWFLAPIIKSKAIEDNESEVLSPNAEMS